MRFCADNSLAKKIITFQIVLLVPFTTLKDASAVSLTLYVPTKWMSFEKLVGLESMLSVLPSFIIF